MLTALMEVAASEQITMIDLVVAEGKKGLQCWRPIRIKKKAGRELQGHETANVDFHRVRP